MNVETSPPPDAALPDATPLDGKEALQASEGFVRTWLRATWTARGVTLGALALGLAVVAEVLLLQPLARGLGSGLLIGALALGAVAWWGLRERPLAAPADANTAPRIRR